MIKSMTGFGRAESIINGMKYTIEIRSVNHRYFETMFKMPKELYLLEDRFKKTLQSYIKRGRIDVFVSVEVDEQAEEKLSVNWNLAEDYMQIIKELKQHFKLEGQIHIQDLIGVNDLIQYGKGIADIEETADELVALVQEGTKLLLEMRQKEGYALFQDFSQRLERLKIFLSEVETRAPIIVSDYRERIKLRLNEYLTDVVEVDETRLLNEVAFFAEKANIDEEITRLKSHFEQFNLILNQNEAVGRKLDFLIQEMNREVNTIGSKANDIHISKHVVDIKSELEKLREQVQNVE